MTIKHAEFDTYATVLGTGLQATNTTLLTMTSDADVLILQNTSDKDVIFSVPARDATKGNAVTFTNKDVYVNAGISLMFNFRTNDKSLAKGIIGVRYAIAVGTSGSVTAQVLR